MRRLKAEHLRLESQLDTSLTATEAVRTEFEAYMGARYQITINRLQIHRLSQVFRGWIEAAELVGRQRKILGQLLGRHGERSVKRPFLHWRTFAAEAGAARAQRESSVEAGLQVQTRWLLLSVLSQWARAAKTVRYERGEHARLEALAGRASIEQKCFGLQADLASLKTRHEDTSIAHEHLLIRTSTRPSDRFGSASPLLSAPFGEEDGEGVAEALEARAKWRQARHEAVASVFAISKARVRWAISFGVWSRWAQMRRHMSVRLTTENELHEATVSLQVGGELKRRFSNAGLALH